MRQPGWRPQGDVKTARGSQLIKASLYTGAAESAKAMKPLGMQNRPSRVSRLANPKSTKPTKLPVASGVYRLPVAKILANNREILHDYRQHQASTRSELSNRSLLLIMYPAPMFGHDCGDFELGYRKRFFLRSFLYVKRSRYAQAHTKQNRDPPS